MWEYHTDDQCGWKYSVTSKRFIIQMTGGSITILDNQTKTQLKRYKGHHYLYTGDISPDETQCFALENGKHFYVYSLDNYELIKRVTLPRGYECIDMYGHYAEDGAQICIPAKKWIGNQTTGEGHYEYVMCRYAAQQLTLIETVVIDNPKQYRWRIGDPQQTLSQLTLNEGEMESLQRIADIVSAHVENKDFRDCLFGAKPREDNSAVKEIMNLIFDMLEE